MEIKNEEKRALAAFMDPLDRRDYWVTLDEQLPGSSRGWIEYYSILFPNIKIRVGDSNAYTEAVPFEGVDFTRLRRRIEEALRKRAASRDLLDIAISLGVKIV